MEGSGQFLGDTQHIHRHGGLHLPQDAAAGSALGAGSPAAGSALPHYLLCCSREHLKKEKNNQKTCTIQTIFLNGHYPRTLSAAEKATERNAASPARLARPGRTPAACREGAGCKRQHSHRASLPPCHPQAAPSSRSPQPLTADEPQQRASVRTMAQLQAGSTWMLNSIALGKLRQGVAKSLTSPGAPAVPLKLSGPPPTCPTQNGSSAVPIGATSSPTEPVAPGQLNYHLQKVSRETFASQREKSRKAHLVSAITSSAVQR